MNAKKVIKISLIVLSYLFAYFAGILTTSIFIKCSSGDSIKGVDEARGITEKLDENLESTGLHIEQSLEITKSIYESTRLVDESLYKQSERIEESITDSNSAIYNLIRLLE